MKYSEKDKKKLIEAAIASWDIDISQATKRVNALIQAIDNGLFNGIPETGPEGCASALQKLLPKKPHSHQL
jgi:hypothetical protein